MSISLPLVKSFTTHPLYHGRAIGPRCDRVTIQIPSARSIEPNLNTCRNFFPRKFELSNICKNLYKHFQSGFQESVVKPVAAATGYSASDGSSKSDGIKKQEKIELRMKIPEEPKLKNDGGPHIEDGDNKGGNGHGGDGKGNSNRKYGDSEGNNEGLPKGSEWLFWWWKWLSAHQLRPSQIFLGCGCHQSVYIADAVELMVATGMTRSLMLAMPAVCECIRQLKLDELVTSILLFPFLFPFLFEFTHELEKLFYGMMGAVLGVVLAVPLAGTWWISQWLSNRDREDDDNGSCSDDGESG